MYQADSAVASMTAEERIQKAKEITQSRILTQEEFRQIRLRQMAKEVLLLF